MTALKVVIQILYTVGAQRLQMVVMYIHQVTVPMLYLLEHLFKPTMEQTGKLGLAVQLLTLTIQDVNVSVIPVVKPVRQHIHIVILLMIASFNRTGFYEFIKKYLIFIKVYIIF